MGYLSRFESKKKAFLFKFLYKPLLMARAIHNLIFDFLYFLKYNTIKKDPQESKKRTLNIQRKLYFLKRDLGYFIFRL
jgi:hypothetical protein